MGDKSTINYYLLLIVRILINFADSLFYIVSIFMISKSFDNPVYTGIAVSIFTLPDLLLLFIGPIIDRVNPKKILLVSIIAQIVAVLFLLLNFEGMNILFLYTLLFVSSFSSAISYPLEESIIPNIVEKNRIIEANSIFHIAYEIIDAIFNGLSGLLLAIFSYKSLYRANLYILLLAFIPIFLFKHKRNNNRIHENYSLAEYRNDLKEGIIFVKNSYCLISVSLPLIIINLYNALNATVLPYYCGFYNEPELFFGYITIVSGVGGIVGGIISSTISKKIKPGRLLFISLFLKGLFWLLAVLSGKPFFSLLLFGLSYVFSAVGNTVFSAFFQLFPPENMVGRVNTIIDTVITIAMPLGGFLGGYTLRFVSPIFIYGFFGVIVIIVSTLFGRKKMIEVINKTFL